MFLRYCLCFLGLLILFNSNLCFGWSEYGALHELRQPDGSRIPVRIWGDEDGQQVQSLDGCSLIRDPETNWICYAQPSADGQSAVSSGEAIRNGAKPSPWLGTHLQPKAKTPRLKSQNNPYKSEAGQYNQSYIPIAIQGSVRGICVLVDFPDETGSIPPSEVDKFCNETGYFSFGNSGSVHDYFYDVSDGKLIFTNLVLPAYYTARHAKNYYDDFSEACNASSSKVKNLVAEVLEFVESNGYALSDFDSDNDLHVDALSILYAGTTTAGFNTGLWPHSGQMPYSANGIRGVRYQICDMRQELPLGLFCHEIGHTVCRWQDLYDPNFDSYGVGAYCLMGTGYSRYQPPEPCAYLKLQAGWATILDLQAGEDLTLEAGTNRFYKFRHPNYEDEYFLIEARAKSKHDTYLPDSGLAIWHIDDYGGMQACQQMSILYHYRVSLVQSDGNCDLESHTNTGDSTDLWSPDDSPDWTPDSSSNSNWWEGNSSGIHIHIKAHSATATVFSCKLDPVQPQVNLNTSKYIPDPNFRKAFEDYLIVDRGAFISKERAKAVSKLRPVFDCRENEISDITGCHYACCLTRLLIDHNKLTHLNLEGMTHLQELYCQNNQLEEIDLSQCKNIRILNCSANCLSDLDVSEHKTLTQLYCSSNNLSWLDISGNSELKIVDCSGNKLIGLYYPQCGNLSQIDCSNNQIDSLDWIIGCTAPKTLDIRYNNLDCSEWHNITALQSIIDNAVYRKDQLLKFGFAFSPQNNLAPYHCPTGTTEIEHWLEFAQ